jgi:MYXO-CTERM domain-containing protein
MLAIVIAAGLTPESGIVRASSNCTYGNCPASTPFPVWAVATTIAVVVLALLLALLLLRRRRRPPAAQAPPEWEGPAGAGAGVAAGTTMGEEGGEIPAWQEPPPPPPDAPAGAVESPEYLEGAAVAPPVAAAGAAAVPGPAPEAEPDIDSLMSELDKISEEILKRPTKKPPAGSSDDDEPSTDGSS